MNYPANAREAAIRSALYWLLAEAVLHRPDAAQFAQSTQDLIAACAGGPYERVARTVSAMLAAMPAAEDDAALDALGVEHAYLFGGLKSGYGLPAPHESVAHETSAAADVVMDVMQAYTDAGFGGLQEPGAPADHLGVELKFMALLCHEEMKAWQSGCEASANTALETQNRFLTEHLLPWAAPAFAAAGASSASAFFGSFTELGVGFLDAEQEKFQTLAGCVAPV